MNGSQMKQVKSGRQRFRLGEELAIEIRQPELLLNL